MQRYQTRISINENNRNTNIIALLKQLKEERQLSLYVERAVALMMAVDNGAVNLTESVKKDWQNTMSEDVAALAPVSLSHNVESAQVVDLKASGHQSIESAILQDEPKAELEQQDKLAIASSENIDLVQEEVRANDGFRTSLTIM